MTTTTKKTPAKTFSDFERAAMQERARELAGDKTNGEEAVLAKIAQMTASESAMAKKIHEIVKKNAPELGCRTWYGMPAYTNKEGKVVLFFKAGSKYKSRYCTLGFEEAANLDEGNMWVTSFALEKLTPAEESKIAAMVKKAIR